jgi:dihydrodipicolinate synthase/N-acetylneuraminate lyase
LGAGSKQILGRIRHYAVRPPLVPVDAAETDRLRAALVAAGLPSTQGHEPATAR